MEKGFGTWVMKVNNYLYEADILSVIGIIIKYLGGNAHKWWIFSKHKEQRQTVEG